MTKLLKSEGISVVHINGRSLHRSYDDIVTFLNRQAFSVDFLLISESWLDPALLHGYQISGYQMIHVIPDGSFLGKGCAIYIKDYIFPYCKILDNLCTKQMEYQSLFIQVKYPNTSSFIVGATYRSPSYPLEAFLTFLESTLCTISNLKMDCLWGGDWNVNLLKYNELSEVRTFLNCFSAYGFFPTITIPTRTSNTHPFTSTLIDNIFSNAPNLIVHNGTVCTAIADHLTIFCIADVHSHKKIATNSSTSTFDFKRVEELKQNVALKLNTYLEIDDPDRGACILTSTIQKEMAKLSSRRSRRQAPIQPWITPTLVDCIEKRNKLLKQFLKNKTSENEQAFRRYRNTLRLTLRHAKKIYYSKQFQKHSNNPKLLWDTLKEVSKINKQRPQLPVEFKIGNASSDNPYVIAEEFNNYYSNVGPNGR